jgi:hypothetical protein
LKDGCVYSKRLPLIGVNKVASYSGNDGGAATAYLVAVYFIK